MRLAAALAALLLLVPGPARAEDALPPRQQALLLLRVLAYDRSLAARAGDAVTIGVAFHPGDAASESARDALVQALRDAAGSFSVAGLPVKVVPVPWGRAGQPSRLPDERLAALWVGPGLEREASAIARATRERKALTFAPARAGVEAGLSVALVTRGTKAGLVLNRNAARAEGAELDSALLAIAEVVDGGAPVPGPRP